MDVFVVSKYHTVKQIRKNYSYISKMIHLDKQVLKRKENAKKCFQKLQTAYDAAFMHGEKVKEKENEN